MSDPRPPSEEPQAGGEEPPSSGDEHIALAEVISLADARERSARGASDADAPAAESSQPSPPAQPPRTLLGAIVRDVTHSLAQTRLVTQPTALGTESEGEDTVSEADETRPAVVDLTAERLRRKGPHPGPIDLTAVVRDAFERFVDSHEDVVPTTDDRHASDRALRIDGRFVETHGAGVLSELIGTVARNITANLVGMAAAPTDIETDAPQDPQDPPAALQLTTVDPSAQNAPVETKVTVDFLSVLAALIKPPPEALSPTPSTRNESDEDPT